MKYFLSICTLLIAFVISGCSGGQSGENGGREGASAEQQSNQSTSTRTIDVYGVDKLKYVVAEKADGLQTGAEMMINDETYYVLEGITAQAGAKVKVNMHTISNLPPQAMSHNWALLKQGTDVQAFNNASQGAKDNDYIAPDMEDRVITETGLVGNGNTKSVTMTVPQQTGEYDYLCTFPAHYTAGMKGKLTVQ